MNNFKEIKKCLTCEEVVQRYLGLPVKHNSTGNWYLSPFRSEKTASFCVSNKGIHDFGDSKHYDIISFTQEYFHLSSTDALKLLSFDFNISLQRNEFENKQIIQRTIKRKQEEELAKRKINKWYNKEMQNICDKIQNEKEVAEVLEKNIFFIKPEALQITYQNIQELEDYFDELLNATEDKKIQLYLRSN